MLLKDFEQDVLYNVMIGTTDPKITNSKGETPIIVTLDSEPVAVLMDRVKTAGGEGTVYSRSENGRVRVLGVLAPERALPAEPTDFIEQPPSRDASIGMFIDYVETQSDGVLVPGELPDMRVKSYGKAQLVEV